MKKFYLALLGLLLSSDFVSDAYAARKKSRKNRKNTETPDITQEVKTLTTVLTTFLNTEEGKKLMVEFAKRYPGSLWKAIKEQAEKGTDGKLKEMVLALEKDGFPKDPETAVKAPATA